MDDYQVFKTSDGCVLVESKSLNFLASFNGDRWVIGKNLFEADARQLTAIEDPAESKRLWLEARAESSSAFFKQQYS